MRTALPLCLVLSVLLAAGCDSAALHVGGGTCSSATDAKSCAAIAGCTPIGCATCDGGKTFEGCIAPGEQYGLLCSLCQPACETLTTTATCDARSDCYSVYSGDRPCNNASCSDHFLSCKTGPAQCMPGTGVCTADCALPSVCRPGFVPAYSGPNQSCCPFGCVAAKQCPGPVPCTSDATCGAHAYCKDLLQVCKRDCQLTIGSPQIGTCHRSCDGPGTCDCVEDADCPGAFSSCDGGTCKSIQPPICHAPSCPAGCTESTSTEYGSTCICNACSP